jgi:hypothetical protein
MLCNTGNHPPSLIHAGRHVVALTSILELLSDGDAYLMAKKKRRKLAVGA